MVVGGYICYNQLNPMSINRRTLARIDIILAILLVLSLGTVIAGLYILKEKELVISELTTQKQNLLKTNAENKHDIESGNQTIALLTDKIDELSAAYSQERDKNEDFEDQLRELGAVVGDLNKLSKTDKELLEKYSKVYFLNENYTPSDLDRINPKYVLTGKDPQYFHGEAIKFLEDMIEEAADDGIELKVISAYRSFDHQNALKGQFTTVYGTGANTFSADQGYSEHQLGTTLDITDPATSGTYTSFKDTEAYAWLLKNAYKYGFIMSYEEDNKYYIFEPWHWRFVGRDLARDLHRANASFYDWDQRDIDKYLISIFD